MIKDYIYLGDDLGANYNKEYTLFKVWSPFAQVVKVIIYDNYHIRQGSIYNMSKSEDGIWQLDLQGDYSNMYYNYLVTIDNIEKETPDPYAKSATVNGIRGMIVDFNSLNPKGWDNQYIPPSIKPTESIIYETHIRDFSMDSNSCIKNKGKFLAFTEEHTQNTHGVFTGLAHLKELGITHVHLLPIFDFQSVNENNEYEYNWGYDPYLYNVPEGSYSTNPYDGRIRIMELKQMIQTLHKNNIRIVMDVVYNHTFKTKTSPFDILVPKYYYRTFEDGSYSNGSGCGNELASEKPMVRKFIIDSLKFWATEYKIDGFRFDLMALHDIDTMALIEKELKKINSNILIYGEPWTGGFSSLDYNMQFKKGSQRGLQIAIFNDHFRNAIKGDNDGTSWGFIHGAHNFANEIKKGIVGSISYNEEIFDFAKEPYETINYVSSHDNLTLYDKIIKSNPNLSEKEIEKMNKLALSIILTSQGIPFINGGSEMLRNKKGHHNSYNAGDEINKINWNNKYKYKETFDYIRNLLNFRKSQRVMTLDNSIDIVKSLSFIESPNNTVAYILTSPYTEDYKHIIIIHNANKEYINIKLPFGNWNVIANDVEFNINGVTTGTNIFSNEANIAPLSTYVLYNNE